MNGASNLGTDGTASGIATTLDGAVAAAQLALEVIFLLLTLVGFQQQDAL